MIFFQSITNKTDFTSCISNPLHFLPTDQVCISPLRHMDLYLQHLTQEIPRTYGTTSVWDMRLPPSPISFLCSLRQSSIWGFLKQRSLIRMLTLRGLCGKRFWKKDRWSDQLAISPRIMQDSLLRSSLEYGSEIRCLCLCHILTLVRTRFERYSASAWLGNAKVENSCAVHLNWTRQILDYSVGIAVLIGA